MNEERADDAVIDQCKPHPSRAVDLSVIVPVYNAAETLPALLDSLCPQLHEGCEVILVDDASADGSPDISARYPVHLIRRSRNRGPAACRNAGAKAAQGNILVFTDSDCRVHPGWLEAIRMRFSHSRQDAIMGRVVLPPSSRLGDAISALGFPAGGSVGFEKIWPVNHEGLTTSLSTCNCALTRQAFFAAGGLDESFPFPGGEDSLLAYRLLEGGFSIRYCPEIAISHGARDDLAGFIRWQFKRGISSYLFSSKVARRGAYVGWRFRSTANVVRKAYQDRRLPLVMTLFAGSAVLQVSGFIYGRIQREAL